MKTFGNRHEVWCGEAQRTRYGLTKDKLVMSNGKIVSKVKHDDAMANKTAYLEKMNSRRTRARAPASVTIRPSTESTAVSMPSNRAQRPEPSRESRLRALAAAAARTY